MVRWINWFPLNSRSILRAEESCRGKEKVILEILEDSIHADVAFFSEDNIARAYTFLDERFKPG